MSERPPNWAKLYGKHFPNDTDGASRHVKIIAREMLRSKRSKVRKMLADAGYDPDHMARSMESTVIALWETRAELARLKFAARPAVSGLGHEGVV